VRVIVAFAAILLAGVATTARANTITLSLIGGAAAPAGTLFQWSYQVRLTGGSAVTLSEPSRFTMFDLGGYVLASASFVADPAFSLATGGGTFVMSESSTGPAYPATPDSPAQSPVGGDSSSYENITGTYVGGSDYVSPPELLGILTLYSTTGVKQTKDIISLDVRTGPPDLQVNAPSTEEGPSTVGGPPILVPVPIAAAGGLGLFGLFGGIRARRRSDAE